MFFELIDKYRNKENIENFSGFVNQTGEIQNTNLELNYNSFSKLKVYNGFLNKTKKNSFFKKEKK